MYLHYLNKLIGPLVFITLKQPLFHVQSEEWLSSSKHYVSYST